MIIETKTQKGAKVKLELINTSIKADIDSPYGKISGIGNWGTHQGVNGFILPHAKVGKKYRIVCLSIPKEDYLKIKIHQESIIAKKEKVNKEKALTECPNDYIIARCLWTNGDLMSGEYQAEDGIKIMWNDLQESHYGWYFVPKSIYVEAKNKYEEKKRKSENQKREREEKEKKLFQLAKSTNMKQKIESYMTDCTDCNEECNTDIVTVWAMPDGTKKETNQHTW